MSEDIKKGLMGVTVDETEISKVMPEINSLTYRGYAAQDLCEYCRFEEVAYLILNKDLPNTIQLRKFENVEKNNRELSKDLYSVIKKMPKKSHPMDVARTAVSIMGLEDKETTDSSPDANMRKAVRIMSKTPTALAAFYMKIPVAHVEAGLRSNDIYNPFPEEVNRRLISQIASLHFAPTKNAMENLLSSKVNGEIHVCGNSVVDALFMASKKLPKPLIKVIVLPFLPFFCFEIFIFDFLLKVSSLAVSSDFFS